MSTLGLGEAVSMALEANPELGVARFSVLEAAERVSEAWGNVFPSIDLTTTYTRNLSVPVSFLPAAFVDPTAAPDEIIPLRFGSDNIWDLSIDIEQPLFNAAAFIGVGAAGRFQALQDEGYRGQAQAVVTRVREAYYRLLLNQEQVRLLENSIRRVEQSLDETRSLEEAGLVSEYDVLRLEVELANLTPNLRRAAEAVAQDRRALAIELGVDQGAELHVRGALATMRLDDLDANSADNLEILSFGGVDLPESDTAVARAMRGRSDLLQLELTENLRMTEMRLEQVQYLPEVALFGAYGMASQQQGGARFFGDPRGYRRIAGVRVSLPIFQGFQRDARVDQRRAVLEQARLQTEYARDQARNEVQTLLAAAEEARDRATAQQLAVGQATRGFEIASVQYREGLGTQLELTDAEVALRQSEFNYAQAVHDYLVARARLDRASGMVPVSDMGTDQQGG
jgi:outer membrane protein TolC